jgi:protein-tyrosine-phosphatase
MVTNHIPRPPPPEEGTLQRRSYLLFVCDGNICRSPLALAFFHRLQAVKPGLMDWEAGSAGLVAAAGDTPLLPTQVAARVEGISLQEHRACPLPAVRRQADLVLIMEERQREPVARISGQAPRRVLMLGEFSPAEGSPTIADPFGGTPAVYRDCVRRIGRSVAAMVAWLGATPAPAAGSWGPGPA